MLRFSFAMLIALGCRVGTLSQTTQPPCSPVIGFQAQKEAMGRTGVGAPYSLVAAIKVEQKLSDGNSLSGFITSHQARDSQGRTRVDEPWLCAMDKDRQPHWEGSIEVDDPVANTYTLWQQTFSVPRKIATVTHVASLKVSHPLNAQEELSLARRMSESTNHSGEGDKSSTRTAVEDLGKRDLAGLDASGMRITSTRPAGVLGNALPLVVVEEKWISDRYGLILLDTKEDPLMGKSTYEVTNFVPGEPDAALFQPPADYRIEDRPFSAN